MKFITRLFFAFVMTFVFANVMTSSIGLESPLAFVAIAIGLFALSFLPKKLEAGTFLCIPVVSTQKLGDCGKNPAGMQVVGYMAFTDDIDVWPAITPNPVTDGDHSTLLGGFTMKTDKYFIEVYNTKDKSTVEDEGIGPVDGKQFKSTASGFIPGIDEARISFMKKTLNANVVYIGIDKVGRRRVVGSKENPAKVDTMKLTEGMTPEDARGLEYSFTTESADPALFYGGSIPFNVISSTAVSS